MKYLTLLVLLLSLNQISLAQSKSQKKKEKKEARTQAFEEVKELFETKRFRFQAEWANTQKGRRINLIGNPNSYIQKGDSISADLPYYGVAQVASMSGDVGINIENALVEKERTKVNDKKLRLVYSFNVVSTRSEVLSCTLTIYANQSADLSIRSTHRNMISYSGNIEAL